MATLSRWYLLLVECFKNWRLHLVSQVSRWQFDQVVDESSNDNQGQVDDDIVDDEFNNDQFYDAVEQQSYEFAEELSSNLEEPEVVRKILTRFTELAESDLPKPSLLHSLDQLLKVVKMRLLASQEQCVNETEEEICELKDRFNKLLATACLKPNMFHFLDQSFAQLERIALQEFADHTEQDYDQVCRICLDPVPTGTNYAMFNKCDHSYCEPCIRQLIATCTVTQDHLRCPTCRIKSSSVLYHARHLTGEEKLARIAFAESSSQGGTQDIVNPFNDMYSVVSFKRFQLPPLGV